MKQLRVFRPYVAAAVAILSMLYAVGDFCGWWDRLAGRDNCRRAVSRLASTKGFPESFIYKGETEFDDLLRLAERKTQNEVAKSQLHSKSVVYFTRGDISISFKGRLPEEYPNQYLVPDISPVLAATGVLRKDKGVNGGTAFWLGTIGDFRQWIDETRASERFWVQSVLLGLLSISIALLDFRSNPHISDITSPPLQAEESSGMPTASQSSREPTAVREGFPPAVRTPVRNRRSGKRRGK
jgi:hypothetical protein